VKLEHQKALAKLQSVFPSESKALIMAVLRSENEKRIPDWRAEQLIKFIGLIEWFVEDVQVAYEKERVMTIAWLTRNLLEIFVWVRYCNGSEERAKRFDEDAMRDFFGYITALIGLNIHGDSEVSEGINKLLTGYKDFAKTQGVQELADDYKRVRNAAKDIGDEKMYVSMNKILSKLAHPTSLALDAALREVGRKLYRDIFIVDAMELATRSLEAMSYFLKLGYGLSGPTGL
jgi:hypothetical protein